MKLLFYLEGKREEFAQGCVKGIGEAGRDGVSPCEDEHTPSAEGGVNLGDCGERFGRGEGIGDEKSGAVDDRNLTHS